MPITLFLIKLFGLLLMLWFFVQDQALMNFMAWLLVIGFFVMLAEAFGLVRWAVNSLFGKYPSGTHNKD